ncbi:MAG: hypothetical protein CME67_01775 [Halobacteriovoraceae bacterium]|nr:hypothetical protein [Halobacteriovoraceae bacterium]
MNFLKLTFLFCFLSCSLHRVQPSQVENSQNRYYYKDKSGEFIVDRSVKVLNSKIIVKNEVFAPNELNRPVEKTITVSKLGTVKSNSGKVPGLRPEISQHTIWFEGQKYFSQLKINLKDKSFNVSMESPDDKWNGQTKLKFPKGQIFCFFSQIPECAKRYGLLNERQRPIQIQVIWDNFPYHNEIYDNLSTDGFEKSVWAFDGHEDRLARFGLLIGQQLVLYEFDSEENFVNMYWVLQGISMQKSEEQR